MTLFQPQQSTKREANQAQPDSNAVMDQETVQALTAAAVANQFPQMRELLKQKQAKFGAGPQYNYWAGILAAREGRFDDALALLEDAANRAPRIPAPRYELGNVLCALNRPTDAALAFESAILLNKSFVAAWINLGKVRLALGEITRAEHALTTAMGLDHNRVEIWLELARLHEQAKFPDRAVNLLQDMRRHFGAEPARDAELLRVLIACGKQNQTVELLEEKQSSKDSVKAELELIKKTAEDKQRSEAQFVSLREVRICFLHSIFVLSYPFSTASIISKFPLINILKSAGNGANEV